ncbi:MAG: hypothetical protein RLZZ387_3009 [Chloroflexota bacterium]|jgi:ferritin-like metal-binding protein YciE/ElaB/YqjD/DUF883 family membrane-anchored ribosome-binding protein
MTYDTSNTANTGNTSRTMDRAQDQARQAVDNARSNVQDTVDNLRQKAQETFGQGGFDLKQQLQERPWVVIGALAAAGYFLSKVSSSSGNGQSYQGYQGQQPWQSYQGQQPWQGQQAYSAAMEQAKHYESSQHEGMASKIGRRMFANMSSLEELFREKLQDMYDAEHQILKALPMMIEAATSHELKQAFDMHLRQTQGQIQRLDQVFYRIGMQPTGKTCTAIRGILAEGKEVMGMRADPEVKDAAMIGSAQHVEHHEIAAYGTLRTWARQLGQHDVAQMLQQILNEEEQTDRHLSQIAERSINRQAMHS